MTNKSKRPPVSSVPWLVAESTLPLLLLPLTSFTSKSLPHPLFTPSSSSGLSTTSSHSSTSTLHIGGNLVGPLEALLTLLITIFGAAEELLALGGTLFPHCAHHLHLPTLAHWSIHSTPNISSTTSKTSPSTKCCNWTATSTLVASSHHLISKLEEATLFTLGFGAAEKVPPFVWSLLPHSS